MEATCPDGKCSDFGSSAAPEAQYQPQIEKRLIARRTILSLLILGPDTGAARPPPARRGLGRPGATGRLRVKLQLTGEAAKTDTGHRDVKLLPVLRDLLAIHKAGRGTVDPGRLRIRHGARPLPV